MKRRADDLYAVLGVRPSSSAADLRRAYQWILTARHTPEQREAVRSAYAVLGDPRLRAEYDGGRAVGLGAGIYHERRAPAQPARTLESSWQRRQNNRGLPCAPSGHGLLAALSVSLVLSAAVAGVHQWRQNGARPVTAVAFTPAVARPPTPAKAPPKPASYIPPFRPGSCLSGADNRIDPAARVACTSSHRLEVIRVLNLNRLLGRPVTARDTARADEACTSEFRAFTGLAGPLPGLGPLTQSDLASTGTSYAVCFVMSDLPRSSSARRIAA